MRCIAFPKGTPESVKTTFQVGQYKSTNTDAAAGTKAQILTQPALAGYARKEPAARRAAA